MKIKTIKKPNENNQSLRNTVFAACVYTALTLSCSLALAADIYVSTTGNDANPGTLAAPVQTIKHALQLANSGDTIFLRGGTYTGGITITKPNITLTSYSGEWGIISSPFDDPNLFTTVVIDFDAHGTKLQRLEIIGGFYYTVKLESNWDWNLPVTYGASNASGVTCR